MSLSQAIDAHAPVPLAETRAARCWRLCHEVNKRLSDSSPRVKETLPSQRPHRILTSADVDAIRSVMPG